MDIERELNWDDEIVNDSEFVLLKAGDYNFEVIKFERGRSQGSDKIPPSNMAILQLRVFDGNLQSIVTDRLILHTKMEWKLSQFFCSIGQKKKGEPLRMNWNNVVGAKGKCKVIIENYEGKEYNKISTYYPSTFSSTKYVPGKF